MFRGTFLRKNIFFEQTISFCFPFWDFWRRNSRLAERNLAGISKVIPTGPGLNYEENFIVLEVTIS